MTRDSRRTYHNVECCAYSIDISKDRFFHAGLLHTIQELQQIDSLTSVHFFFEFKPHLRNPSVQQRLNLPQGFVGEEMRQHLPLSSVAAVASSE